LNGAVPVLRCGTIDAAVKEAHTRAVRGEVAVLAPACASFDQFDNYEHRGREFTRLVGELME
jgi:UDP-N-acetylmuramoylalanine--D-glutamate ligase